MSKRLIALTLTIFLGAGAGHIYLKKFAKGLALIAANLIIGGLIVWRLVNNPLFSSWLLDKPDQPLENFINAYQNAINSSAGLPDIGHILIWHDIALAALLAYALIDVWRLTSNKNNYDNKTPDNDNK